MHYCSPAAELQRRLSLGQVTYVAHTGLSKPGLREKCSAAGFHHFLRKPVDFQQIESVLRAVVALRKE